MKRLIFIFAAGAVASACSLAPDRAAPSWTDALLAESSPGAAPATVDGQPIDRALRAGMLSSAVDVQSQGLSVRETGLVLLAPTLNTADFVVEARARAQPPAPQ